MSYQTIVDYDANCKHIREAVPTAALYEQLAEECTEAAQAALKMVRSIRGENPPRYDKGLLFHLQEELMDIMLCCDVLEMDMNEYIAQTKAQRWVDFLKEKGLLEM